VVAAPPVKISIVAPMLRAMTVAALAIATLAAPAAEAKTKRVFWQQNAAVPSRFLDQIGYIPINGIQPEGSGPKTVKAGSVTYKVTWINALYGRTTTTEALRELQRDAKHPPVIQGVYADRRLTSAEKRRFQVLLDLARDGDVLVVHRDNPVCASGLTLAQARGIARGTITRWSQVATLPPGQPDVIVRRLIGSEGFAQPRFGVKLQPGRSLVKPDGGVSQVRAGDRAVAAVTAWTKVRQDSRLCAVALNGVAPTDGTVRGLEYPGAYPVSYVMHRKRRRDREGKALVRAYVAFLRSAKASEMFRRAGVLLAKDEPAGGGGPSEQACFGPSHDHMGRPITVSCDTDAGRSALTGARLDREGQRFAFDAGSTLYELGTTADGQCQRTQGQWEVLAGWRYPENGGGIIAQARLTLAEAREVTIEFPNDSPGVAYINGEPYTSDSSLSSSCP
jgi:hypothetical protein